jgi:hypothetical protein
VIVRISGEGQYRLPDEDAERLNELDNLAVAATQADDQDAFRDVWHQMLDLVQGDGRPVDDDELLGSDVILPPRDLSFAEAKADFTGEGLIPD